MKLNHLLRKAIFRSRVDGFKDMFRELIYLNRTMVVIEKNLREIRPIDCGDIRFVVASKSNFEDISDKHCGHFAKYYCGHGARCILAYRGNKILGYQFYTTDNSFPDLQRIGILVGEHEAYLFDFFVFPEYRGTDVPKKMAAGAFMHLISEGIDKIYGFYFSDNIRSLWWHRAFLKCKEIKRIEAHRLLFLEWTGGRMALNFK